MRVPLLVLLVVVTLAATRVVAGQTETVAARRDSIRGLLDAGQFLAADEAASALVNDLRARQDSNPTDLLIAGDLYVESLVTNGRGAEGPTRELARRMVADRMALGIGDGAILATSERNLGRVSFQAGDYSGAIGAFKDAISLLERSDPPEPQLLADVLDGLAAAYKRTQQDDLGLDAANRALALRDSAAVPSGVNRARTLDVRGGFLQKRADYAGARSDFEEALALQEAAHPLHPDTAEALNVLGVQCYVDGDLVRSYDLLQRSLTIAEATLRPEHPAIAEYLKNLSYSILDLGDVAQARLILERSLAIARQALGEQHPVVAFHLIDLAGAVFMQGDYEQARRLYEDAKAIDERVLGPQHSEVTTIIYNLGLVSASLGDLQDARQRFSSAASNWGRQFGRDHPFVALAMTSHGEALAQQGRDREAIPLFEAALAIRRRAFAPDHPSIGQTMSLLGRSLARTGSIARASSLSEQALSILDRSDSPDNVALADALLLRAEILLAAHDLDGARTLIERALETRTRNFGPSHPQAAEARLLLATVLAQANNWPASWQQAMLSEESTRDHRRMTLGYLPERQALEYTSSQRRGLDLALSWVALGEQDKARTLDAVIRSRALVLDELALRRKPLRDGDKETIREWETLSSIRQRYANLLTRGPGQQNPVRFAALVDEVRRLKESAERELAGRSAVFRAQEQEQDVGIGRVCAQLNRGDAIVSFVRYQRTMNVADPGKPAAARLVSSYLVFILKSCETPPVVVRLGTAASIDALVNGWRRRVIGDASQSPAATEGSPPLGEMGASLRRRVWDPLTTHLSGIQRVFVVPDGSLSLLPFGALPAASGRYLIEDGPVLHYLSAERDVDRYRNTEHRAGTMLSVGGPSYYDASSFATLTKAPVAVVARADNAAGTFRGEPSRCPGFQSMRFRPLPGSRLEAEAVAELWRTLGAKPASSSDDTVLLTGSAATESTIKSLGPGRSVLHIATHGFFLGDGCPSATSTSRSIGGLVSIEPAQGAQTPRATRRRLTPPENPLLLSGLAFAGANRRSAAGPDEDDGILTAEEVTALNLDGVEWVVLSACDTGLGTLSTGEGVLGLRRAFQIAGARTVIMSLWSVEDRSARRWMSELYRARLSRHLDTANSVRAAAVAFIEQQRAKGVSTNPFYWAGFVAAGDWH